MGDSQRLILPSLGFGHLFNLECETGEPYNAGDTPGGLLKIIPVLCGRFKGERMKGQIMRGGASWNTTCGETTNINSKYDLKMDDGAIVSLLINGWLIVDLDQASETLVSKLGEPPRYRFNAHLIFSAGKLRYRWLNDVIAFAVGNIKEDGKVVLNAYALK